MIGAARSRSSKNRNDMVKNEAVEIELLLMAMKVVRDSLDLFCKLEAKKLAVMEDCEQKLKSLGNLGISEEEAVSQILSNLPPRNASALLAAVMDVEKLLPLIPPEKLADPSGAIKDDLEQVQRVRKNLHVALDGVV